MYYNIYMSKHINNFQREGDTYDPLDHICPQPLELHLSNLVNAQYKINGTTRRNPTMLH